VASAAVHEVIQSAAALEGALGRLHDVAPRLHLDARKLCEDVTVATGESAADNRTH
jgi:hypothetical protein